jgi:hypothetical protein
LNLNKLSAWANIGSFFVGLIALVYLLWPKNQTQGNPSVNFLPAPIWVFVCTLLLAGFLHLAAARIQSRTPTPTTRTASAFLTKVPSPQQEGRVFLGPDITAKFLSNFYREHTTMQANKMVEIYIGKWIKTSGSVRNVGDLDSYGILVFLEHIGFEPKFTLVFDKKWVDRLSVLRPGNPINVIGKIYEIHSGGARLVDCELIES